MNIVEAYIKFRGQMIILISGMSGSGITTLSKRISKDFKIDFINSAKYQVENFATDEKNLITLQDGTTFVNWDSDELIDWGKLNGDIKKYVNNKKGVVVCGQSFPKDKMDPEIVYDTHIHVKLTKQNLMTLRHAYIERHKDKFADLYQQKGTPNELFIFNKYTFPYYLETASNAKITHFINGNDLMGPTYAEGLYNQTFDYLIQMISQWLNNYNAKLVETGGHGSLGSSGSSGSFGDRGRHDSRGSRGNRGGHGNHVIGGDDVSEKNDLKRRDDDDTDSSTDIEDSSSGKDDSEGFSILNYENY